MEAAKGDGWRHHGLSPRLFYSSVLHPDHPRGPRSSVTGHVGPGAHDFTGLLEREPPAVLIISAASI